MLKKLSIFTVMLLASNFTVASQTPDQEEPAAKRAKIDRGTATTSIAAAPAVTSVSRRSEFLDVVTGGQYSLQDIILGYLDNNEWVGVKQVAVNDFDSRHTMYVTFSPDGKQIAFNSRNSRNVKMHLSGIKILNVLTGQIKTVREFNAYFGSVRSVQYSPDGEYLAYGSGNRVTIIDAATGSYLNKLFHEFSVNAIAWSPDGKQLASFSRLYEAKAIAIWSAENGGGINRLKRSKTLRCDSYVTSLSWSSDGKRLAAGLDNGSVEIWDPATGNFLRALALRFQYWVNVPSEIRTVAWSPDGKKLASGSFGEINIWDVETDTVKKLWAPHTVYSLSWSPDSKYLVSGGQGGWTKVTLVPSSIAIWDLSAGTCINTFERYEFAALSRDGNYLAGSDGETIKIWENNGARAMTSVVQKVEHVQSAPSVCRGAAACTIM